MFLTGFKLTLAFIVTRLLAMTAYLFLLIGLTGTALLTGTVLSTSLIITVPLPVVNCSIYLLLCGG